ncbi:hypothetical protein CRUP_010415 [Coryphaenoides rupestris]|nr:hypothetical protein CRUP_010415 [Coryphaenoides rupestris]
MVDYITEYLGSIKDRKVIPEVKPGYMRELLPDAAPSDPESWDTIFKDIERIIMPGGVHWQSPHMHAYYPSLPPGPPCWGMLADAINCIGFTLGAEEGLWLHVDAAYAGTAYFCPELRWVKDKYKLQQTFSVDPVYLRHENSQAATDFMV